MFFKKIHSLFPFADLLKFIVGVAVGIQVIIITYNHFSGFFILADMEHFLLRLLRGTLLSVLAGFIIAYPDIYFIQYLNKYFPWKQKTGWRLMFQFIFAVFWAFIVSVVVTLLAHALNPYTEDLILVLRSNALIYGVVNVIMMITLEAWLFSMESTRSRIRSENLERELSQIRFEVLKNQINPHFMFNSLNVLSGLIAKDPEKAQLFVDEFSQIYRYVLESIEKQVVTLSDELGFARSYMFLQQIRYGENLIFKVHLPADLLSMFLPPLSLQIVLENAIKHNLISNEQPLTLEIYLEKGNLWVKNNLQPKISGAMSTRLGQKNMIKRYAMITHQQPEFIVEANEYKVKLPLISAENENTDR
ncbi:MAG: sensor histidine kinase [Bacteroidales bacterium]